MVVNGDFHLHTMYSGDLYLRGITPQKVLSRAFKNGLEALAVTDTNKDFFYNEVTDCPAFYLKGKVLLIHLFLSVQNH